MSGPRTVVGKSSSQLIAIVQRRDSLLPEPMLKPLVPEPSGINAAACREFVEFATTMAPELYAAAMGRR